MLNSLRPQQVGDWLARERATYSRIEQVLAKLRRTGSDEVELEPRVGPRILRAWFDTVINPLVQSLESELFLLGRLNWTFSFRLGKLELIRLGISSLMEIFGSYPPADRYGFIAQYVINSAGEQASHNSFARFWNRDREVLVQTLHLPGIREQHASAVELSEHLKSVTRTLVGQLKTFREQLSLRHDVPLVTNGR